MKALDLLNLATTAGIAVSLSGDRLRLSAKREPPVEMVEAIRRKKSAIVDLLKRQEAEVWRAFFEQRVRRGANEGCESRADAEAAAYSYCIMEWQNRNPVHTEPGKCAECGQADAEGSAVVHCAVGARRTWLHPHCWSKWIEKRIVAAESALANFGILRPAGGRTMP